MKRTELSEILESSGVKELAHSEALGYNGGESLWYTIAYYMGKVLRANEETIANGGGHVSTMPSK